MEVDPSAPSSAIVDPVTGAMLCDRYRLDTAIARGASAVVWRATDLLLGEVVAVKVLLADGVFATPQARAGGLGFREEAISAMRLGHPAILRVFHYAQQGDLEFLVMEYVVGETLSQLVKERPLKRLSALETIEIGLECLEGLAHAHGQGVIHNDLKPSNLIMTRGGAVKICDFGLARLMSTTERPVVAGTPGFMSPEILGGRRGDARSDLFSLAATLYAVGNGTLALPRDFEGAMRWQRAERSRHLPLAVDEVLATAMALDPRDRYRSAAEMKRALQAVHEVVSEYHARFAVFAPTAPLALDPGAEPVPLAGAGSAPLALDVSSSMVDLAGEATEPRIEPPPLDATLASVAGRRLICVFGGVVEVPAFRLDRTPVTNEAYAAFVRANGVTPPAHWMGDRPPADQLDHPVVGITLDEARAYAAWCGKRLPSNAEWESAAHGPEGRAFPWGDEFDAGRCRAPGTGEGTAAVGTYPSGASSEGCLDLIGNVWEWTETDVRLAQPDDGFAWVFGGSFCHPCERNGKLSRSAVTVGNSYAYLGFRCATGAGGG
jgi:serine/threonine-protein kinase